MSTIDFVIIPTVFYSVVLVGKFNLGDLRESGWLFMTGESKDSWYKFYTMFGPSACCARFSNADCKVDLKAIQWGPFWSTFPTQLAL